MDLTVHQVSNALNVSVDTIRRWDKKGLIKSSRSEKNYRIFDIDEVKALYNKLNDVESGSTYQILQNNKKTDYSVIELFAGCGGTSLGFENAGLNHILLNEIDKDCIQTLKNNFPKNTNIIQEDVRNLDFTEYKNVDIVQAGFPCQSFSYAGKSLGFEDIRGTLFFEFARCVKETKPKIAVGENVKGLLNHDGGKTLETMIKVLNDIGYRVKYKVLRSQYLDVPQKRERLIILAIRKDLNIPFIFPKEKNYTISLKEALKDCPESIGQKYPEKKAAIMKLIPSGGYWKDLPLDLQKEYMGASFFHTGGRTGMARRLSWDEPSLTLTCSPSQKQTERCHPKETRPLNIIEYARIQTFPDSWKFCGSMGSQYKQIGNAVPVNLSYHIGRCLIAMLDGNYNIDDAIVDKEEYNIQSKLF
jgi:DNA (cytosine-5)-methyltransferase 1